MHLTDRKLILQTYFLILDEGYSILENKAKKVIFKLVFSSAFHWQQKT